MKRYAARYYYRKEIGKSTKKYSFSDGYKYQ